jgi:hypothetical protein
MFGSLSIKAVLAGEDPELARVLVEGQRRALERFGLDRLVHDEEDPSTLLVSVVGPGHRPDAGLRIHRRTVERPLPLEKSVSLHPASVRRLDRLQVEGLVEMGGLWVGPALRGMGVVVPMFEAGIAACRLNGIRHFVGLAGQQTLPFALEANFWPDPIERDHPYPDRRYRSQVCWLSLSRLSRPVLPGWHDELLPIRHAETPRGAVSP